MPILLLLSLGTSDLVGMLRAQLRADAAAQQLGQLVSQCNRIVMPGDIDQFWGYAQRLIGNLGTLTGSAADGAVIISAVGMAGDRPVIAWQQRTGSSAHASAIGTAGGTASLPGEAAVPPGQTMFVTEVFLRREDWALSAALMGGSAERTLSSLTLFLTRAPDAPSLLIAPASSPQPACTA